LSFSLFAKLSEQYNNINMQLVNFTLIFMPLSFVYSFPILGVTKTKSHLNTLNEKRGSRRDVLGAGFGFALISSALNSPADAFTHETYFLSDHVVPTSQLAPSDLLDVNSAFGKMLTLTLYHYHRSRFLISFRIDLRLKLVNTNNSVACSLMQPERLHHMDPTSR